MSAAGKSRRFVALHLLDETVPALPWDRPHYLMGVGKPADIVGAVARGIDMFDCVLPTHADRHGQSAQRPPCRGSGAARSRMHLSGLHVL
jgi:queuine tRNA-ribosyltransferase